MQTDSQILDNFDSLLTDLASAIEDRLDEAVEERGLQNVCPGCIASELVSENQTALLNDLYQIGKDDPQLLMSILVKTLTNTTALRELLATMLQETAELFRDELDLEDADANG
jgi:hypothetical protein